MKKPKMKWWVAPMITVSLVVTGCVHINDYLTRGKFTPENRNYEVGLRPTTTTNPSGQNQSWGVANTPGATGFVLSIRSRDFKTPLIVSNLVATYSTKDVAHSQFVVVANPNERNQFYNEFYLIPTSSLATVNYPSANRPTIKQVVRLGRYSIDLSCEINDQTNHFVGEIDYLQKSHWQKATLGWKD
jgi:hypothetical protein